VCLRSIKGLNYGLKHEKSQARRIAENNANVDRQAVENANVFTDS